MVSNQILMSREKNWLDEGIFVANSSAITFKYKLKTDISQIQKLKELLKAVHAFSDDDWENLEQAVFKLPSWFLEKSPQPMTATEEAIWLRKWRSATPENQIKMNKKQDWAPADWLYWMNPKNRHFFLIGYSCEEKCFVFETSESDTATGAATWMLKITGHLIEE